jgi:uncharacterized repeat protein (TIGR02543 family)
MKSLKSTGLSCIAALSLIAAGLALFTSTASANIIPSTPEAYFTVSAPPSTIAGTQFSVLVTAYNGDGTLATGYTGTVQFTSSDSGTDVSLPTDYTFTPADAGAANFNATLVTHGSQTITLTDIGNNYITGNTAITVAPAATKFLLISAPGSVVSGDPFTFTVTAYDQYGNVATGYTGTISFKGFGTVDSLPGDYTFVPADAGAHTFTNGATLGGQGNQFLEATDTASPISGGSGTIDVAATAFLILGTSNGLPPVTGDNSYDVSLVVPPGDVAPSESVVVSDGPNTCDATLSNPSKDGIAYTGSCTLHGEALGASVLAVYNADDADTNYIADITSSTLTTAASDPYVYDSAGGSPTPASGSAPNATFIALSAAPSRTDYTFAGWSDGSACDSLNAPEPGGLCVEGTALYKAGATYTLYSDGDTVTFTAQWTPDQYVVNFAYDGGLGTPVAAIFTVGGNPLTLPTIARPGYTFDGWYTAPSGGTFVAAGGASYSPTASITLDAQWTPVSSGGGATTYTVTYNYEGGTGTAPSAIFTVGGFPLVLSPAAQSGYTFDGWYTAPTGGTLVGGAGDSYTPSSPIILYAQWTANAIPTTATLSASSVSVTYGAENTEKFTFTVTASAGAGSPTGTVIVYSGTTELCKGLLIHFQIVGVSTSSCSPSATKLRHGNFFDIFITYFPSPSSTGTTYTSSSSPPTSLLVKKDTTRTKDYNTLSRHVGTQTVVFFTIHVTTHNGEPVPLGEKAEVRVGSVSCTITLSTHRPCNIRSTALKPGTHKVIVRYSGDANLSGSSSVSAYRLIVTPIPIVLKVS